MIVAFIGPIGSGKTTAAQALVEGGYVPVNFADPLRQAMEILDPMVGNLTDVRYNEAVESLGYRRAKDEFPEIRRMMQALGTDLARDQWSPDFWVGQWESYQYDHENIVVDDMRFPNEYKAVRARGGLVFRIVRPDYNDPGPDAHESEQHWPTFLHDGVLFNGGTIADLHSQVRQALALRTAVETHLHPTVPDVAGRDVLEKPPVHQVHPFHD